VSLLLAVKCVRACRGIRAPLCDSSCVAYRYFASQERDGLCVSVRGLRKEFNTPDGVKVAVDGIDLTMYGGEIFVLLGECQAARIFLIAGCGGLRALAVATHLSELWGAMRRQELTLVTIEVATTHGSPATTVLLCALVPSAQATTVRARPRPSTC